MESFSIDVLEGDGAEAEKQKNSNIIYYCLLVIITLTQNFIKEAMCTVATMVVNIKSLQILNKHCLVEPARVQMYYTVHIGLHQ